MGTVSLINQVGCNVAWALGEVLSKIIWKGFIQLYKVGFMQQNLKGATRSVMIHISSCIQQSCTV